MSKSPQPPCLAHVSYPPHLSEQSISQFMLNLPPLDEGRLSPELAASATKLRSQFTLASSNVQILLRSVRDAWIAWHSLPVIFENSPGFRFTPAAVGGDAIHADRTRDLNMQIDSLNARIQDLQAELAASALSPSQSPSLPTTGGHCTAEQAALHPSSYVASCSRVVAVDPNDPTFLKCASAVAKGLKRRETNYLRHVFERHKDHTGSLPSSNLVLALTEADAPVIPESQAAAAESIFRFDCSGAGLMNFGAFERAVNRPDDLALFCEEQQQPLLADALRALVGRAVDQLLRVSQLSPSDMRAAYTAVCANIPQQSESLFKELQRSFAAQFEIQALTATDTNKFNVEKMACGGINDFHEGLTGRVGMPHLKFRDAMQQEHCEKAGCNTSFTTGNYNITTTPKQEWLYIAGDEMWQQVACPDMDHGRRIVPISELMKLKLAVDAKLTDVEMLAIVLYTGPMFKVYNCILRRFPVDMFKLFQRRKKQPENFYSTTIFVLVSAVQKISRCTRIPEGTLLYRGLGGLIDLPDKFRATDELGRSGYLDWGIMSTSSERDVALGYSGVKQRRPRAMVMVIEATAVDRGADISEFSQYPGEKEFLWLPCSFVQRVQSGRCRVEVVDGGLVTFVPVRVNLNLKTETVEELLEKKKSMHISGFEFRLHELKQRLQDDAKAGNAVARIKRDCEKSGEILRGVDEERFVDTLDWVMITGQMKKVIAVLEKHRARAAADYGDDAVYRNLVAESLEAVSMARSPMQWWLRDETQNHISYMGMINFEDCSLLSLQRCFESFLRMRYTRAETAEERRAAAVELCKTRKLMCADIHEKDDNGEWPLTALVAKEGSAYDVGLLIAAGADVGALDDGKAPLHIACQFGYASVVEALLAQGADVNQATTDDDGRTPLCIASQNGHTSVVEMLINWGANVNQATKEDDKTPLYFAIKAGHTRIVEALLARDADVNNPATKHVRFMPLNIACSEGNAGIVEALLARRADVNATCNHSGCDYCRWPLFTASYGSGGCTDSTGYASIVEMLLARGADVNRQVQGNNPLYRGETSLFAAVCSDNFSVVETLLAQGADVNLANELGETPLWRAVLFAKSRRFVEVLIAGGADVNKAVVHQEPTRPSDCDCWRNFGDFYFGSTPIFNALRGHDAISLRALLAAGADVTKKLTSLPNRGASPLWVAAFEGHSECLQLLLAAGCDVNACTDDGRSPVDVATANGHSDVVQQLLLAGALQPSSAAS